MNKTEHHTEDLRIASRQSSRPTGSTAATVSARPAASTASLAALAAAVLAACGGGGGGSSDAPAPAPGPAPAPAPTPLSREQASRVLGHGAFGGTAAEIENVRALGLQGWIDR